MKKGKEMIEAKEVKNESGKTLTVDSETTLISSNVRGSYYYENTTIDTSMIDKLKTKLNLLEDHMIENQTKIEKMQIEIKALHERIDKVEEAVTDEFDQIEEEIKSAEEKIYVLSNLEQKHFSLNTLTFAATVVLIILMFTITMIAYFSVPSNTTEEFTDNRYKVTEDYSSGDLKINTIIDTKDNKEYLMTIQNNSVSIIRKDENLFDDPQEYDKSSDD